MEESPASFEQKQTPMLVNVHAAVSRKPVDTSLVHLGFLETMTTLLYAL
jgi:hypothetical protein